MKVLLPLQHLRMAHGRLLSTPTLDTAQVQVPGLPQNNWLVINRPSCVLSIASESIKPPRFPIRGGETFGIDRYLRFNIHTRSNAQDRLVFLAQMTMEATNRAFSRRPYPWRLLHLRGGWCQYQQHSNNKYPNRHFLHRSAPVL